MGRIGVAVAVLVLTFVAAAEAQSGTIGVSLTVSAPASVPQTPALFPVGDGSFQVVGPGGMGTLESSDAVWLSTDAVQLAGSTSTADLLQRVMPAARRCTSTPLVTSSCGGAVPLQAPDSGDPRTGSATVLYMIIPTV